MYGRRKHDLSIMLSRNLACLAFPGSFVLNARIVVAVTGMDSNFATQGYLIILFNLVKLLSVCFIVITIYLFRVRMKLLYLCSLDVDIWMFYDFCWQTKYLVNYVSACMFSKLFLFIVLLTISAYLHFVLL